MTENTDDVRGSGAKETPAEAIMNVLPGTRASAISARFTFGSIVARTGLSQEDVTAGIKELREQGVLGEIAGGRSSGPLDMLFWLK